MQFRQNHCKKMVTYHLAVDVADRLNAMIPRGDRSYWIQEIITNALDAMATEQTEGQTETEANSPE